MLTVIGTDEGVCHQPLTLCIGDLRLKRKSEGEKEDMGRKSPKRNIARVLIGVNNKARECAVFVVVASMRLAAVQFNVHFIPGLQVQHRAVTGVVVILVRVLRDGACAYLWRENASY